MAIGGATGGPHSLPGGADGNQVQVTGRVTVTHPSRAGLCTRMRGVEGNEKEDEKYGKEKTWIIGKARKVE